MIATSYGLDPDQVVAQDSLCTPFDPADSGRHRVVVAGAGSGKTRLLVATVTRLLDEGVHPDGILCMTFTRKAASEFTERLSAQAAHHPQLPAVGTMHAQGLRALRVVPATDKPAHGWSMARCLDVARATSEIPHLMGLWFRVYGWGKTPAGDPGLDLDLEQEFGLAIRDIATAMDCLRGHRVSWNTGDRDLWRMAGVNWPVGTRVPPLREGYRLFVRAKTALNAFDFQDVLEGWLALAEAGRAYPYRYVFVDEAQDNSKVQLDLAAALARRGRLVLVGQVAQSIYAWRGASPETFSDAPRALGATVLALTRNYRSFGPIVDRSNELLDDLEDPVRSVVMRPWSSNPDCIVHEHRARSMAYTVGDLVQGGIDRGYPLDDIAVLCRTNALAGQVETELNRREIPCQCSGGSFWSLSVCQDVVAYAALAAPDLRAPWALHRVYAKPKRYLPRTFLEEVEGQTQLGLDLLAAMQRTTVKGGSIQGRDDLVALVHSLRVRPWAESADRIGEVLRSVVSASSVSADRAELLAGAITTAKQFDSARDFVRWAEWAQRDIPKAADAKDRVVISTIHGVKGREFRFVVLPIGEGILPHPKATNTEEETRLEYVAVTRARDELALVYNDDDA